MRPPALGRGTELLDRAARWPGHPSWRELTVEVLRQVAATEGTDFAAALLYDRITRSPEHGPFIREVDSRADAAGRPPPGTVLAIVPGACYREYPQMGSDGRRLHEDALRHGWPVERVPVASFGAPADNGRAVCDWLGRRRDGGVVLVSLSKGSTDVRAALARPEAAEVFRKVSAWVSLSGIFHGTALASWFLAHPFRRLVARALCWYHRFAFSVLHDLDRRPGGPLDGEPILPAGLRVVHVVGVPLTAHLRTARARLGHRRLASLGPNDGGGILLGDLCRLPGLIYPVWAADNYLQPAWDFRPLTRRILRVALEQPAPRGPCHRRSPATTDPAMAPP